MGQDQREAIRQSLRDLAANRVDASDINEARKQFEEPRSGLPLAEGFTATPGILGSVDVLHLNRPQEDDGVILYFHGGGYVIGTPRTHAQLTSKLAALAGTNAISVDYRLAPENPYPAGLDDALAAYRALLDSGVAPSKVALAGDSAGGGLALATLVAARDVGLPLPAAAVLFSPWTDLTLSGASHTSKADVELILTAGRLSEWAADYAGGTAPEHHLISPLFASLTGLPPLLLQVGSDEILLDDSTSLASRAAAADVEVSLEVTPHVPHVFQRFAGSLDEADIALTSAGAFIRAHLNDAQPLLSNLLGGQERAYSVASWIQLASWSSSSRSAERTRSQPRIGRPRIHATVAPVVVTSSSARAESTCTKTPPSRDAVIAMWPWIRNASPPNIFRSVSAGSRPISHRIRFASSSS
jgi:epsilon-lactone hydrolase